MWKEENNALYAELIFKDFVEAFGFMTKVAMHAELMNHHPEWSNVWNTVKIKLNTHDAGNIVTEKDRNLAQKIEELFSPYSS